jgi:Flp pilus assembly protein TadG
MTFLPSPRPHRRAVLLPSRGARRRGTSAVEFAVVAPVVLLFVFGAIEFGRAMFLQHVAVNTARSACRHGILGTASNATIQATAAAALQSVGVSGGATSVLVSGESDRDTSAATPGEAIDVTVSIPYGPNSWLPLPMYLSEKSLTGRVTMAKE